MNKISHRTLCLLPLLAALLTACSSDPVSSSAEPQRTPASADAARPAGDPQTDQPVDPIVLRLGTGDAKTAPAGDQIRWFATRVAELTDDAITIKPIWVAAGDVPRFETSVAKQAIDGELDLALVATRAWDTVGVDTLTPLNAPFLINSDELVAEVVDAPIRQDLLAGLPEVGVVGMDLWPEGLRHPFGFGKPLNEPGDYDARLIRAPYSETAEAMFEALGAETTDRPPDPSRQRGAESAYRLAPTGVATANVVFYPKINALVANAELEEALTDAQRDVLTQAAEETRHWVRDTWPTDNESARTFCAEGGTIQSASPAQTRAMLRATRPVVDAMAADDVLGPIVEEIRDAARTVRDEKPLADCGDTTNADELAVLNGDYTFTVTAAAGRRAGVTDKEVLDNGSGKYTAHLRGGTWKLDQTYTEGPSKGTSDTGLGDYIVDGAQFTWYWGHEPGQNVTATFRVLPDGSLAFSDVVSAEGGDWAKMATVHFSRWQRIDD